MLALDDLLAGVNVAELERLGVISSMSVSRWKRGIGRPQRAACLRLACALGRDMGEVTDAVASTIAAARASRPAMKPSRRTGAARKELR
jgi:hypothetical protein